MAMVDRIMTSPMSTSKSLEPASVNMLPVLTWQRNSADMIKLRIQSLGGYIDDPGWAQ